MKKNIFQILSAVSALASAALMLPSSARADITNPALDTKLGGDSAAASNGQTFAYYFVYVWQALIVLGGFIVLLFLVWGAVEWIMAGGEKGHVEKARSKMTNAIIGMIILASSYVLVKFVGQLFGFDLLKFNLPSP